MFSWIWGTKQVIKKRFSKFEDSQKFSGLALFSTFQSYSDKEPIELLLLDIKKESSFMEFRIIVKYSFTIFRAIWLFSKILLIKCSKTSIDFFLFYRKKQPCILKWPHKYFLHFQRSFCGVYQKKSSFESAHRLS